MLYMTVTNQNEAQYLLERIERCSEVLWLDGSKPTARRTQDYVYLDPLGGLFSGGAVQRGIQEVKSNADFIQKCAELKSKRSCCCRHDLIDYCDVWGRPRCQWGRPRCQCHD